MLISQSSCLGEGWILSRKLHEGRASLVVVWFIEGTIFARYGYKKAYTTLDVLAWNPSCVLGTKSLPFKS